MCDTGCGGYSLCGRMTIHDILALDEPTAFAIALGELVGNSPRADDFAALRPAEQVVWCVDGLEREVNNGGLEQFFLNSAGDQARETAAALRAIGAGHTANLLERALAVFPDGPSPDRDVRGEQIDALSGESRDALGELDAAFYEYRDDLPALLRAYVARHVRDFE